MTGKQKKKNEREVTDNSKTKTLSSGNGTHEMANGGDFRYGPSTVVVINGNEILRVKACNLNPRDPSPL